MHPVVKCEGAICEVLRADIEMQDGAKHDLETKRHSMFLVSLLRKGSDCLCIQ